MLVLYTRTAHALAACHCCCLACHAPECYCDAAGGSYRSVIYYTTHNRPDWSHTECAARSLTRFVLGDDSREIGWSIGALKYMTLNRAADVGEMYVMCMYLRHCWHAMAAERWCHSLHLVQTKYSPLSKQCICHAVRNEKRFLSALCCLFTSSFCRQKYVCCYYVHQKSRVVILIGENWLIWFVNCCCLGLRLSYNAPLVMSKKGTIQFSFDDCFEYRD